MDSVLSDILAVSHLENQPHQLEEIKVRDLLLKLEMEFENSLKASRSKLTIGQLPELITASRPKLTVLFRHMLDNCLKFRQKDEPLTICIEGREEASTWNFSIIDNGMGIPAAFQEKIFQPFVRLNHRDEYSGNGIGLAVVRKIVEAHHGAITVESRPGKGSHFQFYLKKPEI